MSETVAEQSTEDSDAFKNPSLSWMIGFLFVVSFLGLFSVVPLRKVDFTTYIAIQFRIGNRKLLSEFCFLVECIDFAKIKSSLLPWLFPGHDYRLQIDISKWHCNCLSHQQLPHSCRSQASKVRHYQTSCTYSWMIIRHVKVSNFFLSTVSENK
jgi:hypothetical protein